MNFESFPILPIKITIKAEENIFLPPYVGSMLRGAFGVALIRNLLRSKTKGMF